MEKSIEERQLEELDLDIQEIEGLLNNHADRKNVKVLLSTWVEKLRYERGNIVKFIEQQKPKKIEPVVYGD